MKQQKTGKKLIIFGTGDMGQLVKFHFETDSPYQVVAFTLDDDYVVLPTFEGLEVLGFSKIEEQFPPTEYDMFIAIGYSKMNQNRQGKFLEAKAKGYKLATFISTLSSYLSLEPPGENCCIFEGNAIEPFVNIGDNVIIWSGNLIGHHSTVHHNNFISGNVVIGGNCIIENNCFIGMNATIGDHIKIAEKTLVGAGAIIMHDTEPESVYLPARSVKLNKKSSEIKI